MAKLRNIQGDNEVRISQETIERFVSKEIDELDLNAEVSKFDVIFDEQKVYSKIIKEIDSQKNDIS